MCFYVRNVDCHWGIGPIYLTQSIVHRDGTTWTVLLGFSSFIAMHKLRVLDVRVVAPIHNEPEQKGFPARFGMFGMFRLRARGLSDEHEFNYAGHTAWLISVRMIYVTYDVCCCTIRMNDDDNGDDDDDGGLGRSVNYMTRQFNRHTATLLVVLEVIRARIFHAMPFTCHCIVIAHVLCVMLRAS